MNAAGRGETGEAGEEGEESGEEELDVDVEVAVVRLRAGAELNGDSLCEPGEGPGEGGGEVFRVDARSGRDLEEGRGEGAS